MKKVLSFILALAIFCTLIPMSALAFDPNVLYVGQAGCQLTDLRFTQASNAWLLWDVTFTTYCDGRVWETTDDHPNLIGRTIIPTFTYEGTSVTFNGNTIESGVTEIVLKAENDLIVYNDTTRAEYQISITEETNGLPVVLIDTDGADIPDKVSYVDTSISILGAEIYGGDDIYAATGGIKLRGNSTMGYDKKPYRIKFDSKQNVFGLGKAKSWVLLANYLDPAAMRNDIAYSFATRMNELTAQATGFQVYVPRVRPVEVYLNGEYKGLYDMGDHVQVDGTRIDIDESGDDGVTTFDVGYYLEVEDPSRVIAEWYSESAYYVTIENTGGTGTGTLYTGNQTADGELETNGTGTLDTLYVQIKTPEAPSEEQVTYIQNYLQTVNDLILAKDETVWNYIDKDSFIDWYLANEVFKNTDSGFLSSVKMFKNKGGKLYMGPVWDFDIGSGAVAYSSIEDPTGWRTRVTERCAWYDTLFTMDSFVSAVEARWADLRDNGIVDGIIEDIDKLTVYLKDAADDNYALWHDNYVTAVANTGWLTVPDVCTDAGNWIEQAQYLRSYMIARTNWLDAEFGYADSTDTTVAYVNMLDVRQGTQSTLTVPVNKSFNVAQLTNLYLSVTAGCAFDITFHFDVGSPSLSTDWQSESGAHPFIGVGGNPIPAGTYTNKELDIKGYLPYSSDPNATVITLQSYTITTYNNYGNTVTVDSLYASASLQSDVTSSGGGYEIGGKPTIWGVAEYGQTLTADTMTITPYGAPVTYQWYADGAAISGATSATFTPGTTYIGKSITVAVTGSGSYSGTATSDAVVFNRQYNATVTSQVPSLVSKTDTTITITMREGAYEASIDGVNWYDTDGTEWTFEGLTPNTLYRIRYRHGILNDHQDHGQPGSNTLYVITDVSSYLYGDVDENGDVNSNDARAMLAYAIGKIELTEQGATAADYNKDGDVNSTDVRELLLYLLK